MNSNSKYENKIKYKMVILKLPLLATYFLSEILHYSNLKSYKRDTISAFLTKYTLLFIIKDLFVNTIIYYKKYNTPLSVIELTINKFI